VLPFVSCHSPHRQHQACHHHHLHPAAWQAMSFHLMGAHRLQAHFLRCFLSGHGLLFCNFLGSSLFIRLLFCFLIFKVIVFLSWNSRYCFREVFARLIVLVILSVTRNQTQVNAPRGEEETFFFFVTRFLGAAFAFGSAAFLGPRFFCGFSLSSAVPSSSSTSAF
jgi:hypothetical protein